MTARFNNVDFAARYMVSPFLFFSVGYDYLVGKGVKTTNGTTVGNQHYHQVSTMGDYLLSKRTDVYLAAGWQRRPAHHRPERLRWRTSRIRRDSSNNHQFIVRAIFRHKF